MAQQFIYQMQGLKKTAPNGKEILRGIWLSYFPGAKIGVVGPNGAGKSTLLKIMAGVDTDYDGETLPMQRANANGRISALGFRSVDQDVNEDWTEIQSGTSIATAVATASMANAWAGLAAINPTVSAASVVDRRLVDRTRRVRRSSRDVLH